MNVCEFTPLPRPARIIGVSAFTRTIVARVFPDAFSIGNMKSSCPMPFTISDVEIGQTLDVLRARLVITRVDVARQQRPHFVTRQLADDVGGPGIVRMKRDADLQRCNWLRSLRIAQQRQARRHRARTTRCESRENTEARSMLAPRPVRGRTTCRRGANLRSPQRNAFLCAVPASRRLGV